MMAHSLQETTPTSVKRRHHLVKVSTILRVIPMRMLSWQRQALRSWTRPAYDQSTFIYEYGPLRETMRIYSPRSNL